jgi:hypothetical protein
MTIDERLEELTERHEALTQTVEILAGMQQRNEERIKALAEAQRRTEERMGQVMDTINSLARIAEAHEQRRDRLEGQQ